jgi:hypothetical protein
MHRQICWVDRLEDGIKREVRVTVLRGEVKWQFKLATEERWDYKSPASRDDWDSLLQRVENRHQRRNATLADLELVRRLHREALARLPPPLDAARHESED